MQQQATAAASAHTDTSHIKKVMMGSAAGTVVEWFDFALFGYMAVYIAQNFFPTEDKMAGLLATFAVFLVSFIVRPLGGIYFGKLGDKLGRKKILALTVLLMSGSTAAIGLIPNYESIGIWAPILLVIIRCIQGLSAGGEYTGATIYTVEHSPMNKRNSYAWAMSAATYFAFALAAGVCAGLVAIIGTEAMGDWGWRTIFLLAVPMGVVAFFIRDHLSESPEFQQMRAEKKGQVSYTAGQVFKAEGRNIVKLGGFVVLYALSFYIFSTYMNTFLRTVIGLTPAQSLTASMVALLFVTALTPIAGIISDKIGRRKMMQFAAIWHALFTIPAYMVVNNGASLEAAIAGMLIIGIGQVAASVVAATLLSEMFPTDMRYTASSMCYNITFAIFGGTAPYLAIWLTTQTGSYLAPAFYVTIVAAICFFWVTILMPETANKPLRRYHTEPEPDTKPAINLGKVNVS
ncbi:MFS transporter [Advenella sp. RU8]|uniref:MFS transporter n=1 Tax=Advenella sp. RU8 TaxID=3399575 RepID=UPI003AAC17D8